MNRPRLVFTLALAIAALAVGTPAQAAKDYRAERYDVQLALQPDGSMRVTETVTFAFGPDSFTYVYRELSTRRTDGLTFLGAAIDGRPLTPGKGAGQYEVRRADNGRRRIVWHFDELTDTTRTFEVTYVVRGLAEQGASADVVRWLALPDRHEYTIGCANLTLTYPPSATLIGAPRLNPRPTRVQAEGPQLGYQLCPVGRDDSWLLTAEFAPRTLAATAPQWQQRDERYLAYVPIFVGIGGFILVGGILAWVVFRLNHRADVPSDPQARMASLPDDLPAGFATALARSGQVHGPVALATLLDLAARGAVRIEETEPHSRFWKRGFQIVSADTSQATMAHERQLLSLLFTSKSGPRTTVGLSDLGRILQSPGRWKRFTRAMRDDLRTAGFVDAAREQTRGAVHRVALVFLGLGITGFVVGIPLLDQVGPALLLIPGALMGVALTGFAIGASLPLLTDDGQRRAGLWAAHGRYLKDVAKSATEPASPDAFGRALPYAAGFGVAVAWAKALERHGMKAGAPWLRALTRAGDQAGSMDATVAMLAMGHTASGHAGGGHGAAGVGAGAAGGGASGAG